MNNLGPPPTVTKLTTDNQTDYIWKKWISSLYAHVDQLLSNKYQHITLGNANLGKGTSAPAQAIIGNYNGWQFTIGDDAVMNFEMPHDADPDYEIGVHFTFVVNEAYATNSGEVQFQVAYSCVPHIDGGETITAPGDSGTLTTGDINIPATAYEPYHVSNLVIPAADWDSGDIIGITLSRIAITAGNNPTAHPVVLSIHIEYTRKSLDWYGVT